MVAQPNPPRLARRFGLTVAAVLTGLFVLAALVLPPGQPAAAQQPAPTATFTPTERLRSVMSVIVADSADAANPMDEYFVAVGNDNTLIVGVVALSGDLRLRLEVFAVGESQPKCTKAGMNDSALFCNQSLNGPNLNRLRVYHEQGSGGYLVFAEAHPGTQQINLSDGQESETMIAGDMFMRWGPYVANMNRRACVNIRQADNSFAAPPANLIGRVYNQGGETVCRQNETCQFNSGSSRYYFFVGNATGVQHRVRARFRESCS